MILVKSAIFQLNAISHRCKEPRCCTLPVGKALKHKAMQLFWGFHIPIADQRSVVITWEWNGSTIGWVWVIHIQGNKSNRVETRNKQGIGNESQIKVQAKLGSTVHSLNKLSGVEKQC